MLDQPQTQGRAKLLNELPLRLHHHAYAVKDQEVNRHFIEDVLGIPLVATWCERVFFADVGHEVDYCHTFFEMADGGALAFFQYADDEAWRNRAAPPQELGSQHVAFKVSGLDQYGQTYPIEDVKWSAPGCSISNEGVLVGSEASGRYLVEAHAGGLKAEASVRVLTDEEPPPPPPPAGKIKWSGVVPPRKWTTFYTKVIAKLTSSPDLKLQVTIEAPAGEQAASKINELKSSLRDLGLDENVES